jgi:cytochrome c oxidase subunit IV
MNSQHITKLAMRLAILSIAATAFVGIFAIAVPTGNWELEIRILLSTLTIAAASICGLASGLCFGRGHRILPGAGLVLTIVTACLILYGIWAQNWGGGTNWEFWEYYWKTTWVLGCYAIACAHLSLLFMANLAGAYRWAYLVAYQLILGLATVLAAAIIYDDLFDKEAYWRTTGVLSILVAAITLMVPVFHRMSREEVVARKAEADPLLAVESEIARVKKQLIELESKRQVLLGRTGTEDGPAR